MQHCQQDADFAGVRGPRPGVGRGELAERLIDRGGTPSALLRRRSDRDRVQAALALLRFTTKAQRTQRSAQCRLKTSVLPVTFRRRRWM
jgi:hypothetical protein